MGAAIVVERPVRPPTLSDVAGVMGVDEPLPEVEPRRRGARWVLGLVGAVLLAAGVAWWVQQEPMSADPVGVTAPGPRAVPIAPVAPATMPAGEEPAMGSPAGVSAEGQKAAGRPSGTGSAAGGTVTGSMPAPVAASAGSGVHPAATPAPGAPDAAGGAEGDEADAAVEPPPLTFADCVAAAREGDDQRVFAVLKALGGNRPGTLWRRISAEPALKRYWKDRRMRRYRPPAQKPKSTPAPKAGPLPVPGLNEDVDKGGH